MQASSPWARGRPAIQAVVLAVVYWLTAKFGLGFDAISGVATTVWPPTGIALAALVLFGPRLWPAVAAGAFAVNATTHGVGLGAAAGIAAGNTLEAVAGAWFLRRADFHPALDRTEDVMALVVLGAFLSTTISATAGTITMAVVGATPPTGFAFFWLVWWMGDAMGDLLVAALLFAWSDWPGWPRGRRAAEAAALAGAVAALCAIVFTGRFGAPFSRMIFQAHLLFPALLWAGFRFGPRGATAATIVLAAVAVAATALGRGPFVRPSAAESLFSLQAFMAVVALTILLVGAAAAERRQAVRVRDEFLSIASHELKTPLTSLLLRLESLRGAGSGAPAETVDRWLVACHEQTLRLDRLVEQLLDVSRIRAGRLALDLEDVDVSALVQEVALRSRDQCAEARCPLDVTAAPGIVCRADRTRVEQVVTNLLANAIRHARGKPISVSVARADGEVRIVVADGGRGIAPDDRARIFEAFERAAERGVSGLGLGLYIVRQIVEAHGGLIQVRSDPGEGATFTVGLPVSRGQRA